MRRGTRAGAAALALEVTTPTRNRSQSFVLYWCAGVIERDSSQSAQRQNSQKHRIETVAHLLNPPWNGFAKAGSDEVTPFRPLAAIDSLLSLSVRGRRRQSFGTRVFETPRSRSACACRSVFITCLFSSPVQVKIVSSASRESYT
jgi:hypothetical protein